MLRNLKALGLLVVAALAMSAMLASAAQAEGAKGTITAGLTTNGVDDHTHSVLLGVPEGEKTDNYFIAGAAKQKLGCPNASVKYTGTSATGVDESLTITPDYANCRVFNKEHKDTLFVTVTMNGCDYVFNQPTTVAPLDTGTYTGTADLVCPEEGEVVVHIYLDKEHKTDLCTISVEEFENKGSIHYKNISEAGKKDDITITAEVKEIPYTEHGSCATGATTKKDAEFFAKVTLTGETEGNAHDVWISDE